MWSTVSQYPGKLVADLELFLAEQNKPWCTYLVSRQSGISAESFKSGRFPGMSECYLALSCEKNFEIGPWQKKSVTFQHQVAPGPCPTGMSPVTSSGTSRHLINQVLTPLLDHNNKNGLPGWQPEKKERNRKTPFKKWQRLDQPRCTLYPS